MMYQVYPYDLTPHTVHCLIRILKQNNQETMWIENLLNQKGISDTYIAQRCVDIINTLDITLPDNLYGITCNPIYDDEIGHINK